MSVPFFTRFPNVSGATPSTENLPRRTPPLASEQRQSPSAAIRTSPRACVRDAETVTTTRPSQAPARNRFSRITTLPFGASAYHALSAPSFWRNRASSSALPFAPSSTGPSPGPFARTARSSSTAKPRIVPPDSRADSTSFKIAPFPSGRSETLSRKELASADPWSRALTVDGSPSAWRTLSRASAALAGVVASPSRSAGPLAPSGIWARRLCSQDARSISIFGGFFLCFAFRSAASTPESRTKNGSRAAKTRVVRLAQAVIPPPRKAVPSRRTRILVRGPELVGAQASRRGVRRV